MDRIDRSHWTAADLAAEALDVSIWQAYSEASRAAGLAEQINPALSATLTDLARQLHVAMFDAVTRTAG
jgi:hypothetical protein